MALQFGVFDHIEPIPGVALDQIYRERLEQIAWLDDVGFYSYHLAEHHTPAVHSLAPSQNVFLAAAAERTQTMRLGPCVYVLPLHHPVRLIEEICMLDNISDGRMDIGVGRGGVIEAYFWGQDSDVEINYSRYLETLAVVKEGLANDSLTYQGEFYKFRRSSNAFEAQTGSAPALLVYAERGNGGRQRDAHHHCGGTWTHSRRTYEYQGQGALNAQGEKPKIGLVNHLYVAETDADAIAIAQPAWDQYKWNLAAPRRLEAERRGLTQFLQGEANPRPSNLPDRESQASGTVAARTAGSRGFEEHAARGGGGFNVVAGSPDTIRDYMDEYLETGANYFVAAFQWGHLSP